MGKIKSKMNVLFLTDEYYPRFGANSLVVKNLCAEFVNEGHEVYVAPFSYDDTMPSEETYEGVHIHRGVPRDDKKAIVNCVKRLRLIKAFRLFCKWFAQKVTKRDKLSLKRQICAPDYIENIIKDKHIDVVVSICCSVELSFPLLELRKKGRLGAKWIFYMIDPFESHSYYRGIESVDTLRRIQHDIMLNADEVVATSLIYRDTEAWESNEILAKITKIEFPKVTRPHLAPASDDIPLEIGKINVVCTGTKNELVRNSNYTLALIDHMSSENVVFHMVGNGWCESDRVEGNVRYYTPRSHQAIVNMQSNADFLLNIGNVVTNQLPSKVLEYISTGRPIVNVAKSTTCPTVELLANYDSLTIMESEDIDLASERLGEYLLATHPQSEYVTIQDKYKPYTPKYVAQQFLEIMRG